MFITAKSLNNCIVDNLKFFFINRLLLLRFLRFVKRVHISFDKHIPNQLYHEW